VKIYRLAHPQSLSYSWFHVPLGPYAFTAYGIADDDDLDTIEDMVHAHSIDPDYHPGPHQDTFGDRPNSYEFCGFTSLRDLTKWFAGYLRPLGRAGYRLYVYEVPPSHVRVGARQVLAQLEGIAPLRGAA